MKPRDFQTLALKLASGTSAAELRSAVSRAYYAVYNLAVEVVKGLGFHIGSGVQGHGDIQKRLGNSGDVEIEKIGSQLAELRAKRNRADYELNRADVENPRTVQMLVQQSERMIQSLEKCIQEPTRCEKIRDGIEEYERKINVSK